MSPRLRPLWPGARLAGRAVTVRTPAGEQEAVRRALDHAGRGDVVVVDAEAGVERALWGGRMSRLALERGLAGAVLDGAARDVAEIEELGFPVFAIAAVPTGPRREARGELGVPVVCGGITVEPGDVVYGDADGVVVVPSAGHEEIRSRALALAAAEVPGDPAGVGSA